MNTFSAYIKNSSGVYVQMQGKMVFTFSSSALLDERLDEAYLNITASPIETYKPTSEIKIVLNDGASTLEKYYIVASDRSHELPNGSGKYNHEIHLLERTKLLEGIYCQSLCFTNSLGHTYTNNAYFVVPVDVHDSDDNKGFYDEASTEMLNSIKIIKSPVSIDNQYTAPTPQQIANQIIDYFKSIYPAYEYELIAMDTDGVVRTGIIYNNEFIQGINASVSFEPTTNNTIAYRIVIENKTTLNKYAYKISFDFIAVQNQYPLKPWTITECVNRCLDLAEPLFEGDTPRYTFAPVQAEKYANTYAPEFTMTECTLREQLKVIGGYIHAEPRLGGYDADGVYQENYIFFDRYGTGEQSSIKDKPYIYKAFTHDINEYCTHIETSASNLVNALNYAQGVVTEPNVSNTRTVRTDGTNVLLSDTNSFASTDNAIYDIPNEIGGVSVTLYNSSNEIYEKNGVKIENIDITPYIFEETEYKNLSSYEGGYPYAKAYALYYTRGEKGIRGLFFKQDRAFLPAFEKYAIINILNAVTNADLDSSIFDDQISFTRLAFRITYVPIYDTKFSHSKQTVALGEKPFMRVYNQSENLIEARWYGEHIKGVALRLGNVEQTRTYLLKSLLDIPTIGEMIDDYYIVDVRIEFQQAYFKCQIAMSKHFNRISQYVGISSTKRVYEVSERNAYARDILLKNYIVVGNSKNNNISNAKSIIQTLTPIAQIFNPSIDKAIANPINAVEGTGFDYNTNVVSDVILPVVSSAFGNTMVFSWDYKDNYSAGEKVNRTINNKGANACWQTDVECGDYYGRIWWYYFNLMSSVPNGNLAQADTCNRTITTSEFIHTNGDYCYLLRKDSRERLSFNYEIEFVTTDDNIIIGSSLASACPLVTKQTSTKNCRVFFFENPFGKFEQGGSDLIPYGVLASVDLLASQISIDGNALTISISVPNTVDLSKVKSWAILTPADTQSNIYEDEEGNIVNISRNFGSRLLIAKNVENMTSTDQIVTQIAKTIYDR